MADSGQVLAEQSQPLMFNGPCCRVEEACVFLRGWILQARDAGVPTTKEESLRDLPDLALERDLECEHVVGSREASVAARSAEGIRPDEPEGGIPLHHAPNDRAYALVRPRRPEVEAVVVGADNCTLRVDDERLRVAERNARRCLRHDVVTSLEAGRSEDVVGRGPSEVRRIAVREHVVVVPSCASVDVVTKVFDARISACILATDDLRSVCRSVVGDDEAEFAERLYEDAVECFDEEPFSVVDGQTDRERWHRHHSQNLRFPRVRGASPLKALLNRVGTAALARLGYSEPMISHTRREVMSWIRARSQAVSRRVPLISGSAVVWTAPGTAELLPIEIPAARDSEISVEVVASAISPGTERAYYLQLPNTVRGYPFQPGYSAAGVVLSSHPNRMGVKHGDPVAVVNVPHMSVATVPADDVFPVPEGVTLEEAALVQIGVICVQGLRRAAIAGGESVVVVGAGLIGVMTARLAAAEGAERVTVVARSRAKETSALAHGATQFLVAGDDEGEIEALGSPVVIEATGDPAALATAIAAAGVGARVVLLGSSRGVTREIPTDVIRAKRLRLIGAHVATLRTESHLTGAADLHRRDALTFLEHLATGRLHVFDLVQDVVDPREAGGFYRRLARSRDLVCARFDWTRLPATERAARGHLLRRPNLAPRGTDMAHRPVPRRRSLRPVGSGPGPRSGATKPLRIGLLGCGDIALLNADAIRTAPGTELVACFDPVEELAREIAAGYGAVACATSDALLERSDIDAVLLAVPHHLHLPLGAEAASAGKHVVVEKPLAHDLEAGRALVEAAEREGVALSVCFPQRYETGAVEARRLIAEGAVGEVTGMTLRFLVDKPPSYWSGGFSGRAHTDWRRVRAKSGGGVLIMNLSHSVDLFRHLTGLEANVVVAHTQAEEPTSEIEDAVSITVRYANGAIGSILGATAVRGSASSELRLWGRDGQLAIEPEPLVYTLRAVDGVRTGRWQSLVSSRDGVNSRAVYFDRLAAAIDAGTRPDVTGQDGLAVQAFIEAAYRSAATGESVSPQALLEVRA